MTKSLRGFPDFDRMPQCGTAWRNVATGEIAYVNAQCGNGCLQMLYEKSRKVKLASWRKKDNGIVGFEPAPPEPEPEPLTPEEKHANLLEAAKELLQEYDDENPYMMTALRRCLERLRNAVTALLPEEEKQG